MLLCRLGLPHTHHRRLFCTGRSKLCGGSRSQAHHTGGAGGMRWKLWPWCALCCRPLPLHGAAARRLAYSYSMDICRGALLQALASGAPLPQPSHAFISNPNENPYPISRMQATWASTTTRASELRTVCHSPLPRCAALNAPLPAVPGATRPRSLPTIWHQRGTPITMSCIKVASFARLLAGTSVPC